MKELTDGRIARNIKKLTDVRTARNIKKTLIMVRV